MGIISSMKVEIYVQARMGSTRLPGKVLKTVLDKPLLAYLVERLNRCKEADAVAILTTILPIDDVIVDFCKKNKILCYRGPDEDVLSRYYQVAKQRKPDAIVRVTGDCPLIDPVVVDNVIRQYKEAKPSYDYVSNSLERTYPRGLDVEIFSYEVLEKAFTDAKKDFEREHVTPYLYMHPEIFKLKNVSSPIRLDQHRWTVDTPEDFELISLILKHLYPKNPNFSTEDILDLLQQHPDWSKINANIIQKKLVSD